jgi:hypothetical protein
MAYQIAVAPPLRERDVPDVLVLTAQTERRLVDQFFTHLPSLVPHRRQPFAGVKMLGRSGREQLPQKVGKFFPLVGRQRAEKLQRA